MRIAVAVSIVIAVASGTNALRLKPGTTDTGTPVAARGGFGRAGRVRLEPDRDPTEHGTLRLHYVGKPIGYERYTIAPDGGGLAMWSDFDFTDRGGRVQLTAMLRTARDYTPTAFKAVGKSYRFVNVDSEVRIDGGAALVHADGRDARVPLPPQF